jgi:hypothetical protein
MSMDAYDSTQPWLIPLEAPAVLIYADGLYKWSEASVKRLAHCRYRHITVLGDPAANICDVETGDVRPAQAPEFLRGWRNLHPTGSPGTIYCNRSTLPAVQAACQGLEFNVWLATLDGSRPLSIAPPGRLVAVQYQGGAAAPYDLSVVWDESWPLRPRGTQG